MMSGHATIDTAVEATRIGAIDFLESRLLCKSCYGRCKKAWSGALACCATLDSPSPVSSFQSDHSQLQDTRVSSGPSSDSHGSETPSNMLAKSDMPLDLPLREARDAFERAYFEYHLGQENGSMTRVAEKTGLERTHLYRKLKQLGIELTKANRK